MAEEEPTAPQPAEDPMRWIRRGIFLGVLVIGWVFILWQNKFFVSAAAVFVCLGYLAVVSTCYALWRTGVVIVSEEGGEGDSTWGRPLGARGELEREKKTLLKAIKEAEFDREMGKLSKADADQMIAIYRARAIEVIKELDKLEAGTTGTIREQIEREVKARIEIEAKHKKLVDDAAANKKKGGKGQAKAATPVVTTTDDVKTSDDIAMTDLVKTTDDVDTTAAVTASSDESADAADGDDAPTAKEATS